MSEQRSSNPNLPALLRDYVRLMRESKPVPASTSNRTILEAADAIERLTSELAGTKDELYSVDKAAKELGAERDRLTKERDSYKAEFEWQAALCKSFMERGDRLALECAAHKEARSTDNRNLLAHIDRLRAKLSDREEKFLTVHAQRDKYWMETYHLQTVLRDIVRYAGDTGWNPDGVADAAREALAAQAITCDSAQNNRAKPVDPKG